MLLDRYDIGIAVQTEQGLVVPVVHGADQLSLDELDAEVRRLAEAAHAGTLKPEELRGGTFTVTSAGKAAGLFVTPLINHPEVAILGIHRIEERAGRPRRRGRRPPDGERLGHVRPPRDRRQARRRVRARGDRAARAARLDGDARARRGAARASTRSAARSRGRRAATRRASRRRARAPAPAPPGSARRDRAGRRRRPCSRGDGRAPSARCARAGSPSAGRARSGGR